MAFILNAFQEAKEIMIKETEHYQEMESVQRQADCVERRKHVYG